MREGTPYYRIAEKGGYVCLLGVDQDRNTTLHTAEALLRCLISRPKRGRSTHPKARSSARGLSSRGRTAISSAWTPCFGPAENEMGRIGNSIVRLMKSRDLIDLAVEAGSRNPGFALCDNPNCPDCVVQRASIRKTFSGPRCSMWRLLRDSQANSPRRSSRVAAKQAGIGGGTGRPSWPSLRDAAGAETIIQAIARFRRLGAGGFVDGAPAVSDLDEGVELMKLAGAHSISPVRDASVAAAMTFCNGGPSARVVISFYNTDLDSDTCSRILAAPREQARATGALYFQRPTFARCGELPFLASYKKKLRRFLSTNWTWPTPLTTADFNRSACGNAEVKEMIFHPPKRRLQRESCPFGSVIARRATLVRNCGAVSQSLLQADVKPALTIARVQSLACDSPEVPAGVSYCVLGRRCIGPRATSSLRSRPTTATCGWGEATVVPSGAAKLRGRAGTDSELFRAHADGRDRGPY